MKINSRILFHITLIVAVVSISSCKKKCTGGSGGGLTFVLTLQHHGRTIPNQPSHADTVRVRYNSQDAPSSLSGYDTYFVGDAGTNSVRVSGLQCGDYYFFATGLDTVFNPATHFTLVAGGLPYSTSQTSGEIDLNMAVDERQ